MIRGNTEIAGIFISLAFTMLFMGAGGGGGAAPSSCPAGQFVTGVGASLSCSLPDPICSNGLSSLSCLTPTLWYPLTEGIGAILHDTITYSGGMTLQGNAGWSLTNKVYNNPALALIDQTSYATGESFTYSGSNNYTITAWFYWDGTRPIIGNDIVGVIGDAGLNFFPAVFVPTAGNAALQFWWQGCASHPGSVIANAWHFAVWAFQGSVRTMYLDGANAGTDSSCSSGTTQTKTFTIGREFYQDNRMTEKLYFADIRLYSSLLSAQQQLTVEQEMLQQMFPAGNG